MDEMIISPCEVFLFGLASIFLAVPPHAKEVVLRIFIALKIHRLGRV
jgi:hypothetical protein